MSSSPEHPFGSDDSVADPNYVPTTSRKGRSLVENFNGPPAAKRQNKGSAERILTEKRLFDGKYFSEVLEKGNGKISASCTQCQTRIQGFVNVTSNFLRHLRRCDLTTYDEYIGESRTSSSSAGCSKKHQQSFDDDVLDIVVENILPFVESVSFKKAFRRFIAVVKSRPTVVKMLKSRFDGMVKKIKV